MTFHKSAKTHHYHIYPPSTISFSSSSLEQTHLTILEKFLLIIITTNKKSQEWKKRMMFDKKTSGQALIFETKYACGFFFFPTKTLRRVNECENEMVFFRFLSND